MTCPTCETIEREGWNPTGMFHCGDSPRAGIVGCHALWRSPNRIHTVCCHRTFASDGLERKYHQTATGKCRTEAELVEAGAVFRRGEFWGGPEMDEETAAALHAERDSARGASDPDDLRPRP